MPADIILETPNRGCCAHCGLPFALPPGATLEDGYCCHACRIVARIVGRGGSGDRQWQFLKLGVGTLLAMNVMMISLLLYTAEAEPATIPIFRKVMLALSSLALTLLLPPLIGGAVREVRSNRMSLDSLVAGGSLAAFFVSAASTLRGSGHVYFDTATMLPVLVTFGKIIESSAKLRAAELIRGLEKILPATALKLDGEQYQEVPATEISQGDFVRVLPGQRVPVDGTIVDGSTVIEEAAFTGEALPASRTKGDKVIAGTVNGAGSILVEATRPGDGTMLHRILSMTESALGRRAPVERLAEKAAMIFVPIVLSISMGAAFYWAAAGDPVKGGLSALAVLVVACPCTLGIATPLATSVAISRAAQSGIVVRGGDVMERIGNTDIVAFDKTGTLTERLYSVHEVAVADPDLTENDILGWLAPLEEASAHPLAAAIIHESRRRHIDGGRAIDVQTTPGSGVSGIVHWRGKHRRVVAGSATFVDRMEPNGVLDDTLSEVWVSWGGVVRGCVRCRAPVKEAAAATIARLRETGITTLLLSGDRKSAADAVGQELGMDRVEAPCSPDAKLAFITRTSGTGQRIMMVGDGVNDAPALAAAPVGVALGGLDLAKQAGNVVIAADTPAKIPWLIGLSRKSRTIIRQNFAWSFAYNAVALGAAASGTLHPLVAAVAMVASSVTVIGNSCRISRFPDV